ncbi:MAG: NYN domain-containing protein [Acidobacteria bacterium]|nr:NYN domain-containing protein [Acidobacteriota bacterium]
MRGKIAIFIDGNNLFHAARAVGVEIDYAKLLNFLRGNADLLRAFFYTGVDEKAERQQGFLLWMRRNGYRVVEKELKTYADGTKKANLDVEIAVDMLSLADKYDTAVLVSGDEDFAYAINAVAYKGVRVELAGFRSNTSPRLIDVADQFIELDSHIEEITKFDARHAHNGHHSGHLHSSHLHNQNPQTYNPNHNGQVATGNSGYLNNGNAATNGQEKTAITQPLSSDTLLRVTDEALRKAALTEKRELKAVVESRELCASEEGIEVKALLESCDVQVRVEASAIKTLEMTSVVETCDMTLQQSPVETSSTSSSLSEPSFETAAEMFTRISDES